MMEDHTPRKLSFKTIAAAGVCLAAALSILLFLFSSPKLTLRDGDSNHLYAKFDIQEGMEFSVSFIHSVNKSEVCEIYQIREDKIYLTGCVYSAFGAGVATELAPGQTLSYTEDGDMVISDIDMEMSNLSYIVGTVSDHVLKIDGEEISLRDLCGKNSTVRFAVEK